MQNPFTTTFSKVPKATYIITEQEKEVLENFNYKEPTESVYKITGVRGSGKTVLLAKIQSEIENNENNWIVSRLSPARDLLQQFAASLMKVKKLKIKSKVKNVNVSISVLETGGGIGAGRDENEQISDIGIEIETMLQAAKKNNMKIFISIDEVSKTREMIVFASEFSKWLMADYPVYLVCTGLYENIEQLSNVKNLTFFRRAATIKTTPLNPVGIIEMYKSRLHVDRDTARRFAGMTKGYAYAFQKLGALYFESEGKAEEDIVSDLKIDLFTYSYEKIWEELSNEDRELALLLADGKEHKRSDLINKMRNPKNYSVYRTRLIQRGIITAREGHITLALPYFGDYLQEYHLG